MHQTEVTNTTVRPVLKWAGNKFGTPVADRVKQLFKPYRNSHMWVEPFTGVCGMTLEVKPDRALLIDASAEVIGLHRWIRDGGQYVETPAAEHTIERYYQRRLQFQALQAQYSASPDFVDADEFFSLMIWLNKSCFNGLWRVNSNGFFNVPAGANSKGVPYQPKAPDLEPLRQDYQGWVFHCGDFDVLPACIPLNVPTPSFVYADPPYFGTHSAYTAKAFTGQDQKRLAHWLASCSCPVVASNSDHPDTVGLYQSLGFQVELIEVNRSIAADSNKRQPVLEMLAYKNMEGGSNAS